MIAGAGVSASIDPTIDDRSNFDVAVLGAGMSGLAAAIGAAAKGADVVLLEKLPEVGGSMRLSGGLIWTVPSLELYRKIMPLGSADVAHVVVEDFEEIIDWGREIGLRLGSRVSSLALLAGGAGVGYRIEPDAVEGGVKPLLSAVRAARVNLRLANSARALVFDRQGRIAGVHVRAEGFERDIAARAVVVATGGFQGDRALTGQWLGPWVDRCVIRSNPGSTGDGLRMAMNAGAAASAGLHGFYGHLMPARARIAPADFRSLSQFYSVHAVLLNMEGRRFIDESRGDEFSNQALSRQTEATGFLVFDDATHREHVARPHAGEAHVDDPVELVRRAGGISLRADSISELVGLMTPFGIPCRPAVQTITEFDEAIRDGRTSDLPIPRLGNLHRLRRPQVHAIMVVPGITFTHGGVRVTHEMAALDRDGAPIPGLYVAGVDAGGITNEGYVGGLSVALATGKIAGEQAATFAQH